MLCRGTWQRRGRGCLTAPVARLSAWQSMPVAPRGHRVAACDPHELMSCQPSRKGAADMQVMQTALTFVAIVCLYCYDVGVCLDMFGLCPETFLSTLQLAVRACGAAAAFIFFLKLLLAVNAYVLYPGHLCQLLHAFERMGQFWVLALRTNMYTSVQYGMHGLRVA